METTAGSLALVGHKPSRDSDVAARLRAAGAIILGKANLSEWANMRSTRSTSGWSARGGLCRNPYVLDRNPCGSSSGSGVAAAANLCAVAIGTETDGSVVCPASHNSLVGIKPTVGLVSQVGIIPISSSQDTAGPMARTVTDAAHLLVATIRDEKAEVAKTVTAALEPGGLKGARLGVARNLFGFHGGVDAVLEGSLRAMSAAGAVVVDSLDLTFDKSFDDLELDVLLIELKHTMAAYLAELPAGAPKSLADLIAFNKQNADTELAHFGQELFEQAEKKGPITDPAYKESLARLRRMAREDGIDKLIGEHRLDAIVAPTNGPAWTTDLVNGDHYGGGSSSPAAVSGYPNITVPAGFVRELPVGLSIFGAAWSEPALVRIALDFERIQPARAKPKFLPTLEGSA